MGKRNLHGRAYVEEDRLMKRILEVRFSDLEQERELCKQLLHLSDAEHMTYGYTFANIYLVDCLLALGEFESCDFYISRAQYLCEEHGYEDLKLVLCNCAGLYYQSLNDEQNALGYFLEGLELADKLNDPLTKGKLLNNIGRGFSWRGDMDSAKEYIRQAFSVAEPFLDGHDGRSNAVSYLSNLAAICQSQGDREGSEEALRACGRLGENTLYDRIRQDCGWCSHYAMFEERERCFEKADQVINLGIFDFGNKFFAFDMCIDLCGHLLDLDDRGRAKVFLEFLVDPELQMPLNTLYKVQELKIRYYEKYDISEGLLEEYQVYYDLMLKVKEFDNEARAQSLQSQIRLDQVVAERAALKVENRELERFGQLDDLTGLYNRRYFRKLLSKTFQNENRVSLGCILVDIDFFKGYNDFYGHFHGDKVLEAVSQELFRQDDAGFVAGRYGGDEFVCLCIDKSDEEIEAYVQQVQKGIAEAKIPHEVSEVGSYLTLSIGWCNESTNLDFTYAELLQVTDEALYEVKQSGRNGSRQKRLVK